MKTSPLFKQVLVVVSTQLLAFSVGGAVAYPSVLLHQLKDNDSDIHMDEDTASWIGSISGIAGIPSIFMPTLMQWKGRKFGFITAGLLIVAGWTIAYFANSVTAILISESFHGVGSVSVITIALMAISEIVDPIYRNAALRTYNMSHTFGMAVSGLFPRNVHWRTAAILMGIPAVISVFIVSIWPESPAWLAYKGEFDKCKKTFISVRGTDERCIKELQELITAQTKRKTDRENFSLQDVTDKVFYVPIFHMFVLLCLTYWSGTLVILIYSMQLIQESTGSTDYAMFGGIAINFIMFICVVLNVFVLIRYFNNRTVILYFGIVGCIMSLLIGCVGNYLQFLEVLGADSKICMYSLLCYIIFVSSGIIPMAFDIGAEIIPVKYRGIGGSLYVIFTSGLHTSSLKAAPYLFKSINIWGTFLIYILNAIICGVILWKYLPETKLKTLQQIEDFYRHGKWMVSDNSVVDTTELMSNPVGLQLLSHR